MRVRDGFLKLFPDVTLPSFGFPSNAVGMLPMACCAIIFWATLGGCMGSRIQGSVGSLRGATGPALKSAARQTRGMPEEGIAGGMDRPGGAVVWNPFFTHKRLTLFLGVGLRLRGGGTHDGARKKMKRQKELESVREKRAEDARLAKERVQKEKKKIQRDKRDQR